MNTIGENSKINTYSVSNENTVVASNAKTENKVGLDDTAAILSLSEEAFGDGVVTVKNVASTRAISYTEIVTAQNNLRTLGFYDGSNTGYVTSDMQQSILNFQKVYGMAETGELTETVYNKIAEVKNFYNATMNDGDMASLKNTLFGDSRISTSLKNTLTKNLALTWTFLRKGMGLNEVQAAGAMGNIMHESFFCPTNANDKYNNGQYNDIQDTDYDFDADTSNQVAYGLIQWKEASRRSNLASVASEMKLNVSDINVQFACIRDESLDSIYCLSGWNELRTCNTVESATQVFKDKIEICEDSSLATRKNYANVIYNALKTE